MSEQPSEASVTLEELRRLLREYDHQQGQYPEHEYEGWEVLTWLEARLGGFHFVSKRVPDDWPEGA